MTGFSKKDSISHLSWALVGTGMQLGKGQSPGGAGVVTDILGGTPV